MILKIIAFVAAAILIFLLVRSIFFRPKTRSVRRSMGGAPQIFSFLDIRHRLLSAAFRSCSEDRYSRYRRFIVRMAYSNSFRFVAAVGVALLALSVVAWAQSAPADQSVTPAPGQVVVQSCWHPGLSRNIGIAEPSCDAPMAKATPPVGSPSNGDVPGPDPAPRQPSAE
jgi:hypothetical protein